MAIFEATAEAVARAAAMICDGHLVGMPTETVYGLAADATNGRAVAAIYAAKGRPRFNPLIVHVASLEDAERLIVLPPQARLLAQAFWPGPLTLVGRARQGNRIAGLVTAGLDTVAVRVPGHAVAHALITACGRPLAAPSANKSGRISPTTAAHVAADFGDTLAMILDGGMARHGLESTIVDATCQDAARNQLILLRPGAVSSAAIEVAAGVPLNRRPSDPTRPSAPGQLESHYAPRAHVRLNALSVEPGEALLAFGRNVPLSETVSVNLSYDGDLVEAAQILFAALRWLDAHGVAQIAVMPVPSHGLGEAINDRLARAAAPRK